MFVFVLLLLAFTNTVWCAGLNKDLLKIAAFSFLQSSPKQNKNKFLKNLFISNATEYTFGFNKLGNKSSKKY